MEKSESPCCSPWQGCNKWGWIKPTIQTGLISSANFYCSAEVTRWWIIQPPWVTFLPHFPQLWPWAASWTSKRPHSSNWLCPVILFHLYLWWDKSHIWISKSLICVINFLKHRFEFIFSKHFWGGPVSLRQSGTQNERQYIPANFTLLKINLLEDAEKKCIKASIFLIMGATVLSPLLFS